MKNINIKEIVKLRHELHMYPELSEKESDTADRIIKFAGRYNPDSIIEKIGNTGVAIVFKGEKEGPTVMIRADIDALPISENNEIPYKSVNKGISHKCGHDGHAAIAAALIPYFSGNKPDTGELVILFQPAEETGKGAELILSDENFKTIAPDYIFALHNIPGFAENSVIIRNGVFSCASKGMIIELKGKTSHAAEPEAGINPALTMAEMIQTLNSLPDLLQHSKNLNMITVVHARLGEVAFGTSPGEAVVMATLRSDNNKEMQQLTDLAITHAHNIADKHNLKIQISYTEEFSATENEQSAINVIRNVAVTQKQEVITTEKAFPWSEDFGKFTDKYKGAFFGIGAGENHPPLHDQWYDFPDNIIENGIKMFIDIINNYLDEKI